jgi:hypothetical protein
MFLHKIYTVGLTSPALLNLWHVEYLLSVLSPQISQQLGLMEIFVKHFVVLCFQKWLNPQRNDEWPLLVLSSPASQFFCLFRTIPSAATISKIYGQSYVIGTSPTLNSSYMFDILEALVNNSVCPLRSKVGES